MIVMSEPSSYREVYDSPKGRWGRIKIPRVPTNSKGLGIGGQSIKRGMTDCWGMERESPSDTLLSDFHHPDSHPSIGSLGRFDSSLQWISHPSCFHTGGTDCEEKEISIDLRGREKEAMDCLPRHRNKERTGVTLVYTDRQMVAWVLSPFSMVRRKTASIDLGQEIQLALVKQSFFGQGRVQTIPFSHWLGKRSDRVLHATTSSCSVERLRSKSWAMHITMEDLNHSFLELGLASRVVQLAFSSSLLSEQSGAHWRQEIRCQPKRELWVPWSWCGKTRDPMNTNNPQLEH